MRHTAKEISITPTDPRTVVRIIIRFLCCTGMSFDFVIGESTCSFEPCCESLALLWVTIRLVGVEVDRGVVEENVVEVKLEERGSEEGGLDPDFESGD